MLRIGQLKSSSLIAKQVAPIRVILCASPEYLKKHSNLDKPKDLAQHRYLHYSYIEMDGKEDIYELLKAKVLKQGSEFCSNNGDVMVEAAIAGAGFILQPTFIASATLNSGKLVIVLPELEPEPLGLYAVYAHRKLLPHKHSCLIDFVEGNYGSPPYWDEAIL